jgi:hypothetical protein
MKRINEDSGVREEPQQPFQWRLLARLGGGIAAREVMVPVSEQTAEADADSTAEPHAGYYVASQSRPAYVTSMTSKQIEDVFDLVERVSGLPKQPDADSENGDNGAHRVNGNGTSH